MSDACLPAFRPPETLGFDAALAEACRCLQCQDPPCEQGCPARVPVRSFLRKLRFGDLAGAAAELYAANPLAGTCGAVCHADGQCQTRCNAALLSAPIDIDGVQRFVSEWALAHGQAAVPAAPPRPGHVAVVGGGPAGLAAAAYLAREGYAVTVHERAAEPGGVLARGIPAFRLPRPLVQAEVEAIAAGGVRFACGRPADPAALRAENDAVLVAIGWGRSQALGIPGEELEGVILAADFLARAAAGRPSELAGRRVVVVGGGNTSVDAARSAVRLGAAEVSLLYRRSENEMPAYGDELDEARRERVVLRPLTAPVAIGGRDGRAAWVDCLPMMLGEPDSGGRRRPLPAPGAAPFRLPAELVVVGVGEEADSEVLAGFGLEAAGGVVASDRAGRTATTRIYVAGDLRDTAKTVVQAVQDGKLAAGAIHADLAGVPRAELTGDRFDPRARARRDGIDLGVTFLGVRHVSPFILAAAPPTDELPMLRRGLAAGWAGAVLKTTSIEGTPVPLKYPMITGSSYRGRHLASMGNIDLISGHHIDEVERRVGALKEEFPDRVIVASMMGATRADWQSLARRIRAAGADMIECSFSCPQGTLGAKPGFMLGQDPALVEKVAGWVKEAAGDLPVVIKLTPQVADIVEVAAAVKRSGADAICASNTIPSLTGIDVETFEPVPGLAGRSTYSGLSGPAIRPISLRNVAEIARHTGMPMTGTGGPESWRDAVELMALGATTVQFCTAVMHYGYELIDDLLSGLYFYLARHRLPGPQAIVGRALANIVGHDELAYERAIVSHIDQDLCIHCGRCHIACRDGGHEAIGWEREGRRAETDEEKCVGCGLCLLVCPVTGCIELKPKG